MRGQFRKAAIEGIVASSTEDGTIGDGDSCVAPVPPREASRFPDSSINLLACYVADSPIVNAFFLRAHESCLPPTSLVIEREKHYNTAKHYQKKKKAATSALAIVLEDGRLQVAELTKLEVVLEIEPQDGVVVNAAVDSDAKCVYITVYLQRVESVVFDTWEFYLSSLKNELTTAFTQVFLLRAVLRCNVRWLLVLLSCGDIEIYDFAAAVASWRQQRLIRAAHGAPWALLFPTLPRATNDTAIVGNLCLVTPPRRFVATMCGHSEDLPHGNGGSKAQNGRKCKIDVPNSVRAPPCSTVDPRQRRLRGLRDTEEIFCYCNPSRCPPAQARHACIPRETGNCSHFTDHANEAAFEATSCSAGSTSSESLSAIATLSLRHAPKEMRTIGGYTWQQFVETAAEGIKIMQQADSSAVRIRNNVRMALQRMRESNSSENIHSSTSVSENLDVHSDTVGNVELCSQKHSQPQFSNVPGKVKASSSRFEKPLLRRGVDGSSKRGDTKEGSNGSAAHHGGKYQSHPVAYLYGRHVPEAHSDHALQRSITDEEAAARAACRRAARQLKRSMKKVQLLARTHQSISPFFN